MDYELLRDSFAEHEMSARRFAERLVQQLEALASQQRIPFAVPLEHRVKSLESIREKLQRKPRGLKSVLDVDDFIGIRAILLFSSDSTALGAAIVKHFTILEADDASSRLRENEFGYQSYHYLIRMPPEWLKVPSLAEYGDLRAEIQVRTAAQHIWAAASHVLQYKQEQSVPVPLRRAIHRVSALLEIVDREFDQLLSDRRAYVEQIGISSTDQMLDVDSMVKALDQVLPAQNRKAEEPYAKLLNEVIEHGVRTTGELATMMSTHRDWVLELDRRIVEALKAQTPSTDGLVSTSVQGRPYGSNMRRISTGVFWGHVGLVRQILERDRMLKPNRTAT